MSLAGCGDDEEKPITGNKDLCGNNKVDEGEDCDDGNHNDRDGCTNDCVNPECGDGIRQGDEICDDGNLIDDDGCTSDCEGRRCGNGIVEPGEQCDDGNTIDDEDCSATCGPPNCGDGVVQMSEGEECDDGNSNDRDDCSNACLEPFCGDGIVQSGEGCDDGNNVDNDGCTNDCGGIECGNGIKEVGEACDDGNDIDDDDCTNECGGPNCGDGIVQEDEGEECDDGNSENEDSCLDTCVYNSCQDGHRYLEENDDSNPNALEECDDGNNDQEDECLQDCTVAVCGDGFVARKSATGEVGPEQCDDGDQPDDAVGDECESQPRSFNGVVPCYCSTECTINQCGNGVIDPGEECDDGKPEFDEICIANCQEQILRVGGEGELAACVASCGIASGNHENSSCTPRCEWNECGDGMAYVFETNQNNPNDLEDCDDANDNNNDACVIANFDSDPNLECRWNSCGDTYLYTDGYSEVYDQDEDGLDCGQFALAFACDVKGSVCHCDNPYPLEVCDDGNDSDEDSCIKIPHGGGGVNQCPGDESDDLWYECAFNECGDGQPYLTVTDDNNPNDLEDCDDANNNNNDSCIDDCAWNECGDGWRYTSPSDPDHPDYGVNLPDGPQYGREPCDDGNVDDEDACVHIDNDAYASGIECDTARCGDGFTQRGVEGCDDGNGTVWNGTGNPPDNCGVAAGTGVLRANSNGEPLCSPEARADGTCNCQLPFCGDGVADSSRGEECDDGLVNQTCYASMAPMIIEVENDTGGGSIFTCPNDCHRAIEVLPTPGTTCDDGSDECRCIDWANDNDSCVHTCQWNTCTDGHRYMEVSSDDNGRSLEICDDGNGNNKDSCTPDCAWNECGDGAPYQTTEGNIDVGIDQDIDPVQSGDQPHLCDVDPDNEFDDCDHPTEIDGDPDDNDCQDGSDPGCEECDDANADGTDSCVVQDNDINGTTYECARSTCGDGYVQDGEECDDGPGFCFYRECVATNGGTIDDCQTLVCLGRCNGNGLGPAPDDGPPDLTGEDVPGWSNPSTSDVTNGDAEALCEPDQCASPYCGDGIVNPDLGESCDPEAQPWDTEGGCGVNCVVSTCGNGNTDPHEECDDGNNINDDDCSNQCYEAECGDGIVQPSVDTNGVGGEECDDTDLDNTDSCTNLCLWNECGDGARLVTIDEGSPHSDADLEQCDVDRIEADRLPFGVGDQKQCPTTGGSPADDCRDGFFDEVDYCQNNCQLRCADAEHTWWTEYKDDPEYCAFVAEPHTYYDDDQLQALTLSWADAKRFCEELGIGATLVRVNNAEDNDELQDIRDVGAANGTCNGFRFTTGGGSSDCTDNWFWLGLHDESQRTGEDDPPGDWFWVRDTDDLIRDRADFDASANNGPIDLGSFHPWYNEDACEEPDGGPGEQCAIMLEPGFAGAGCDPTDGDNDWGDWTCSTDTLHFFCEFPLVDGLPQIP